MFAETNIQIKVKQYKRKVTKYPKQGIGKKRRYVWKI